MNRLDDSISILSDWNGSNVYLVDGFYVLYLCVRCVYGNEHSLQNENETRWKKTNPKII